MAVRHGGYDVMTDEVKESNETQERYVLGQLSQELISQNAYDEFFSISTYFEFGPYDSENNCNTGGWQVGGQIGEEHGAVAILEGHHLFDAPWYEVAGMTYEETLDIFQRNELAKKENDE